MLYFENILFANKINVKYSSVIAEYTKPDRSSLKHENK